MELVWVSVAAGRAGLPPPRNRSGLVIASLAGAGTTPALLPWLFERSWIAGGLLVLGGLFLGLGQPITVPLATRAVPHRSTARGSLSRLCRVQGGLAGDPLYLMPVTSIPDFSYIQSITSCRSVR